MPKYQQVRAQTSGQHETRTLLGKEYLVVPVVAMVEGVRFGAAQTSGELGVAEEFGKFPEGWNNSPVVMNHPMVDGAYVSASLPTVLEDYQFGLVMNTVVDGDKLKMEAWLDTAQRAKDEDVVNVFTRLEADEMIEVSVGFFTEVEEHKGTFKGQKFTGIWRSIVPDHLAFLSEGVLGACSIEDGCGTPRLNQAKEKAMPKTLRTAAGKAGKAGITADKTTTCGAGDGACPCGGTSDKCLCGTPEAANSPETQAKQTILAAHADASKQLEKLVAHTIAPDLVDRDVRNAISQAINADTSWTYPYVMGFTQTHAIFEAYNGDDWKLYHQAFNIDSDGVVTFTSDPEEVRLITRIVPVSQGAEDGTNVNINSNHPEEDTMPKGTKDTKEAVAVQADADESKGLKDQAGDATDVTPISTDTKETASTVTASKESDAVAVHAAPKVLTAQEFVNNAPEEIRDMLNTSMRMHDSRKGEIVTQLTNTGRCKFTEEYLRGQSLEMLENLLDLADVPSYSGRAAPAPTAQASNTVPAAPKVFGAKLTAEAS